VKANQANYPVRLMCRVLGLSASGSYAWADRAPSARQQSNDALIVTMRGIHAASRQSYGRPRMYAELRDEGHPVNHKRAGRLMKLYTRLLREALKLADNPAGGGACHEPADMC
jgi:putative transposase